jgi:hypothetical protein
VIHKKPYRHFVLTALILAIAFFYYRFFTDKYLTVNVYDTYYVISKFFLFEFLAVWFALCGLGYWILYRFKIRLINWITFAHFFLSSILVIVMVFPAYFRVIDNELNRISPNAIVYKYDENMIFVLAIILFITIQILYFINIFISTIRNRKSK